MVKNLVELRETIMRLLGQNAPPEEIAKVIDNFMAALLTKETKFKNMRNKEHLNESIKWWVDGVLFMLHELLGPA